MEFKNMDNIGNGTKLDLTTHLIDANMNGQEEIEVSSNSIVEIPQKVIDTAKKESKKAPTRAERAKNREIKTIGYAVSDYLSPTKVAP
jgi:hypothetical protein